MLLLYMNFSNLIVGLDTVLAGRGDQLLELHELQPLLTEVLRPLGHLGSNGHMCFFYFIIQAEKSSCFFCHLHYLRLEWVHQKCNKLYLKTLYD